VKEHRWAQDVSVPTLYCSRFRVTYSFNSQQSEALPPSHQVQQDGKRRLTQRSTALPRCPDCLTNNSRSVKWDSFRGFPHTTRCFFSLEDEAVAVFPEP